MVGYASSPLFSGGERRERNEEHVAMMVGEGEGEGKGEGCLVREWWPWVRDSLK